MEYDARADAYFSTCPIDGLHSRMGSSVAFTTASDCSICGAGDFECSHVAGRTYDGQVCDRLNARVLQIREVSMTPHPDYPETFVMHVGRSRADLEGARGIAIPPGSQLQNEHCQSCLGIPSPEDLDPRLWASDEEDE